VDIQLVLIFFVEAFLFLRLLALYPDSLVILRFILGMSWLVHVIFIFFELKQTLDGGVLMDRGRQVGKRVSKVKRIATVVEDVVSYKLR